MRARLWLVLVVLAVLLCPDVALADDSLVDSFGRGFDSLLGNGSNETVSNERDFIEQYEPQEVELYSDSTTVREMPENPTVTDYVNNTVDSFNSVPWVSSNRTLLDSIVQFFRHAGTYRVITLAAGLVFMWWGVRKSLRMIMKAWRKGNQSV